MRRSPVPLVNSRADLSAEQKLAAAVLKLAVTDAVSHRSARRWIKYSPDCQWWCAVAGVPVDVLRAYLHRQSHVGKTTPSLETPVVSHGPAAG
jgi:hypothetical protein